MYFAAAIASDICDVKDLLDINKKVKWSVDNMLQFTIFVAYYMFTAYGICMLVTSVNS